MERILAVGDGAGYDPEDRSIPALTSKALALSASFDASAGEDEAFALPLRISEKYNLD